MRLRQHVARRVVVAAAMVVSLTPLVGAPVASEAATTPPRVSVGDGAVVEGHMGRRYIRFIVSLSWANATQTVTVPYHTTDGSATAADVDYKAKAGTITFLPGQVSKYLAVNVWPDNRDEPDQSFTFDLGTPVNAVPGRMSGTGTIIDDDPSGGFRVSIGDATVPETCAPKPRQHASLEITTSSMVTTPFTVHAVTTPLDATAGSDYTSVTKDLAFTADQDLKELKIPIAGDLDGGEGSEQFQVTITVIGDTVKVLRNVGTVTILDCTPTA